MARLRRLVSGGLLILMFAGVVLGSLAGVRNYRRSLWRGESDTWVTTCTNGLSRTVDTAVARATCTCEYDYISGRWTPKEYAQDARRIVRSMQSEGVIDACLNLAAGYSNQRP